MFSFKISKKSEKDLQQILFDLNTFKLHRTSVSLIKQPHQNILGKNKKTVIYSHSCLNTDLQL